MSLEILLSNDDGIYSSGIRALASTMIKHKWEVTVIAPHLQRSGEGKAITFAKPIRIQEVSLPYLGGKNGWSITGTPADAVIHGIFERTNNEKSPYDLIVSGINSGENTSVHSILTSGTCAVAFEAALLGFPAVAFSIDVPENCFFNDSGDRPGLETAAETACDIIKKVMEQGLPPSVAFLNVNFPDTISEDTPMEICRMAMTKYRDYTIRHEDPRGVPYYWIWGETVEIPPNTDSYAVLKKKITSITPITLHFDSRDKSSVDKELEYLIK